MKQKLTAMIMALVLTASVLTGCGASTAKSESNNNSAAAKTPQILTASVCPTPTTLDPQLTQNVDTFDITASMLEGLMKYSKDSTKSEYGIAKSHTVSKDGLTYTFTLRDAKWSDGKNVTAGDFEYSFKRFFDPKTAASNSGLMTDYFANASEIAAAKVAPDKLGVKAINDKTLEIKTPTPVAETDMLNVLSKQYFVPLRKDIVSANGSTWANSEKTFLSDGPYKMVSYSPDTALVATKNEQYWDKQNGTADQIKYMFFADDSAAEAAFQNGALNIYKYPSHNFITQSASISEPVKNVSSLSTYSMIFNQNKAPFNNKLVRKAFCLAMDSNYFAKTVRQGEVTAAQGIVGPGYADYTGGDFRAKGGDLLGDYDKNLILAKEALAQAGFPGGKGLPKITYISTGSAINKKNAQAFQALMKDNLGVNIELSQVEVSAYFDAINKFDYQVIMISEGAASSECSSLLNLYKKTGYYGLNIPAFDQLMNNAKKETDLAKKSKDLHDAENILINEDYTLRPIYHNNINPIFTKGLSGVILDPSGEMLISGAKLDSWSK